MAGGIPIIRPLKQCLAGNDIDTVMGIVNGTTNYILTKMDGNSGDLVDLVLTGLARLLNEVRIPEATDRSLSESVYNDLIELLAKERSNVLH